MTPIGLSFLAVHLIVPLIVIGWLWKARHRSRLEAVVHCLFAGSAVSLLFMWGQWPLVGSYYLRFVLAGMLLLAVWKRLRRTRALPLLGRPGGARVMVTLSLALATCFLGALNVSAIRGYRTPEPSIALAFPLKGGTYYISGGGASAVLNGHFNTPYPGQRYAIDINKLNAIGASTRGLLPRQLHKHLVFGEEIFSPCSGVILWTHDGEEDHLAGFIGPGEERPAANGLEIECQGVVVRMSHLKKGSVQVAAGDAVSEGQIVGQVGNSGFSQEPHLHLQAEMTGDGPDSPAIGVPMTFGGRFLVRNSLVMN